MLGSALVGLAGNTAHASSTPWQLPDWQYRQRLEIQFPEPIIEPVADVPVYVRIEGHEHRLFEQAHITGQDLRFVDPEKGTVLPHHLEQYNPTSAVLQAWVRVPEVSPTHPLELDLYFGSDKLEEHLLPTTEVWNGYAGVFLMQDGPSQLEIRNAALPDTSSSYTRTRGQGRLTPGILGSALYFNGATSILDIDGEPEASDIDTLPPLTMTAWVKPTRLAGTILGKRDSRHTQWQLFSDSSGRLLVREDITGRWRQHSISGSAHTALRLNEWQFVAVTINEQGIPTFYNNDRSETPTTIGGTFVQRQIPTAIGGRWSFYPAPTYLFQGEIDDVRLAESVLSPAHMQLVRLAPHAVVVAGAMEGSPQTESSSTPVTGIAHSIALLSERLISLAPVLLIGGSVIGIMFLILKILLRLRHHHISATAKKFTPERRPLAITTKTLDVRTE